MNDEYKYMTHASGHCFTDHLPEDWHTWEREELDQWCEDNTWEPFEYHDTDWVFEQAESIAYSMYKLVRDETQPLLEEIERLNESIRGLAKLAKGEG